MPVPWRAFRSLDAHSRRTAARPFNGTRGEQQRIGSLLDRAAESREVVGGALADRRYRELGHPGVGVDLRLRQAFFRRAGDRILCEQPIVDNIFRRLAAGEAAYRTRKVPRPAVFALRGAR